VAIGLGSICAGQLIPSCITDPPIYLFFACTEGSRSSCNTDPRSSSRPGPIAIFEDLLRSVGARSIELHFVPAAEHDASFSNLLENWEFRYPCFVHDT